MNFRTEITPRKFLDLDPYKDHPVLLGSCFADEAAQWLAKALVPVCSNPAGPLFNPMSVARAIRIAISSDSPRPFMAAQGEWRSWDLSTKFSAPDEPAVMRKADEVYGSLKLSLMHAGLLVLTVGTAIYYERDGIAVANCHKQPSAAFERRMATTRECADALVDAISMARLARPEPLPVVLTVSPVRHLKEGFRENTLSKATLHLAVDEVAGRLPDVHYFPAFELLVDDLRDYRFYADDMQHPAPMAVEYVASKFAECCFSEDARLNLRRGRDIYQRKAHRHLYPDSPRAKEFDSETRRLEKEFLARVSR